MTIMQDLSNENLILTQDSGSGANDKRKTLTRTKSNPSLTENQWEKVRVSLTNMEHLEAWGFRESECFHCGKTNSQVDGLLMQCAKCKNAYYCSTNCWKMGSKEHEKYCRTGDTVKRQPKLQKSPETKGKAKVGRVSVTVKTWTGRTLNLKVQLSDTIADLKAQIAEHFPLAPERQRLVMQRRMRRQGAATASSAADMLNQNERTLLDCKIKDGSVLVVEPLTLPVKVKLPNNNNQRVKLDVEPSQTIAQLEEAIAKLDGAPPVDPMMLLHKDKPLEDRARTIQDYEIKWGALITVKDPTEEDATIPSTSQDTLEKPPSSATPPVTKNDTKKLIKLSVRNTLSGEAIHFLQVDPSCLTVEMLKARIAREANRGGLGIPAARQCLSRHGEEGGGFQNRQTLADCGVTKDGTIIDMTPSKIIIRIRSAITEQVMSMALDPTTETVHGLKERLAYQDACGAPPPERQCLSLNKDGTELTTGTVTLASYGVVHEGCALNLMPVTIPIRVRNKANNNRIMSLKVDPYATSIAQVKRMLVEEGCIIPADNQVLTFNGKAFDDDDESKTLHECDISADALLDVQAATTAKFPITVKVTSTGAQFDLFIEPTTTMDQIKTMIQDIHGMPKDEQRLLLDGVIDLDHGELTVSDYNIAKGSVLELESYSFHLFCLVPSGRIIKIYVEVTNSVDKLKSLIHKHEEALPPTEQRLLVHDNGTVLHDGTKLDSYNVKTGTLIRVERQSSTDNLLYERQLTPEEKLKKRKKCYMWYGRLDCPARDKMKEIVARLPPVCELTPADVDLLPWSTGGYALKIHQMNELFLNPEDQD